MTISDGLVIAAFGTAISAMAKVVHVLWIRSEQCREEHARSRVDIDNLEHKILGCPSETCAVRKEWATREDTSTGNGPRIEILRNPRPA